MFARVNLSSVLIVILCSVAVNSAKKVKAKHGPSGMSFSDTTNCTEFSKYGRFNPYSVLHEKWVVFFYWAAPQPLMTYIFTFPTVNHTKNLKKILDGNTILPVMWSARQILMEDQNHVVTLLVERADRGEYWQYPLYKVTGTHKITPRDVRLKQTGDNRLIGFMDCKDETMFAMARMNDVPPKNKLAEEAARLGYKGRRGKSYLYQGHEWLPIPEDDEKNYWHYPKKNKENSSNEDQRSSEEEPEETNKEEETEQKENPDNDNKLFREKHLEPNCIKIEPELWNDPKPDSTENKMLSIEDLNKLDANETININNKSLNESYNSTSIKSETILETNVENVENRQNSSRTSTADQQKVNIDNTEVNKTEYIKVEDKEFKYQNEIDKFLFYAENTKPDFEEVKDEKTKEETPKDEQIKEKEAEGKKVNKEEEDQIAEEIIAEDEEAYNKTVEVSKAKDTKADNPNANYEQTKENKTENNEIEDKKIEDKKAEEMKVENVKAKIKRAKYKLAKIKQDKAKKLKEEKEEEPENTCDICYDSSTSMYSTTDPYTPIDAPYKKTERGFEKNFVSPNPEKSTKSKETPKTSTETPSITVNEEDDVITIRPVPHNIV